MNTKIKFTQLNQSLRYRTKSSKTKILGFVESGIEGYLYAIPEKGDKFLIDRQGVPKTGHKDRFLEIDPDSLPKFGDKVSVDMTVYKFIGYVICYNPVEDILTLVPEDEWNKLKNDLALFKIVSKGLYTIKNPKFKIL